MSWFRHLLSWIEFHVVEEAETPNSLQLRGLGICESSTSASHLTFRGDLQTAIEWTHVYTPISCSPLAIYTKKISPKITLERDFVPTVYVSHQRVYYQAYSAVYSNKMPGSQRHRHPHPRQGNCQWTLEHLVESTWQQILPDCCRRRR